MDTSSCLLMFIILNFPSLYSVLYLSIVLVHILKDQVALLTEIEC